MRKVTGGELTVKGILGIDPGLDGALVLLSPTGEFLERHIMPVIETVKVTLKRKTGKKSREVKRRIDIPALNLIFHDLRDKVEVVVLEQVSSRPEQGVASTFKFGFVAGATEALVIAHNLRLHKVVPVVWSKAMAAGIITDDDLFNGLEAKEKSKKIAKHLYPTLDMRETTRCKNPHGGIVDAVCLAEYGRRLLNNGEL